MRRLVSKTFRWSADQSGQYLSIRTPAAREIVESLDPDKVYSIEIKEKKKKRSLDQNALYWVVLTQVAKKLNISNPRCHNLMLRRYGVPERYGDQVVYVVLPDTDEAAERAAEAETYHLKPTSQVKAGKDGNNYRTYLLLRGSSTYDSSEMSRLVNGMLDEAKELGIEMIWEE
jgi:hypothetical protein